MKIIVYISPDKLMLKEFIWLNSDFEASQTVK